MKFGSPSGESRTSGTRFTHLFARISEEEDGFAVRVRLYDQRELEAAAWGEQMAASFEAASDLIAALADEFSIPQARIKIEIRMDNLADGTQH